MRWVIAVVVAVVGCSEERSHPDVLPVSGVHPVGINDVTSDDFHGRELARRGWDLKLCAGCHGDDFTGGRAKVSCITCHTGGPTACTTCHAGGPTSGVHQTHLVDGGLACAECHIVPDAWDAEGHIRRDGAADPPPAEVTFGALAATATPDRAGPPAYTDGTCSNVYCHGDALHAGGGVNPRPRWDATPVKSCDRCHGAPPPSHAQDRCESCHPAAPHIDGVVQIGRTAGCDGCHGRAGDPAPPFDLLGNEFTTAIGVGAHQAHLTTPSGLRGPIPCDTCHLVPASTLSPGHLDSPAPAEVTASLGWDRGTGTCATAWCHGPGRPHWTQTGEVFCGSCHGVPPASHAPDLPLSSCVGCHPRAIDASGQFLAEHMDGDVDVN